MSDLTRIFTPTNNEGKPDQRFREDAVTRRHEEQVIASATLNLSQQICLRTCIWTQIGQEFVHKQTISSSFPAREESGLRHPNIYKSMSSDQFY